MAERIVVVDFSGTLTQPWLAEQANERRCAILGIEAPDEAEHKKQHGTKAHYDILKEYIGKRYGLADDMSVKYVQNYGGEIELSGKDMKTVVMTELFKFTNFEIAAEKGLGIFAEGMIGALGKIKERGFKLAIVSGTRSDIITGLFAITKCPVEFDYVFGQDPVLSRDDSKRLLEEVAKRGKIEFIIGDKASDFEVAEKFGAKSVFVTWGHPTGGEKDSADFTVDRAESLLDIII